MPAPGLGGGDPAVTAVDHVGEGDGAVTIVRAGNRAAPGSGRARIQAAAPEVDRQGGHPLLVKQGRGVRPEQRREIGPVSRPQRGLVPAVLGEPHGADHPLGDRMGERDARDPHPDRPSQRAERQCDQGDERNPLDRALPRTAPGQGVSVRSDTLSRG